MLRASSATSPEMSSLPMYSTFSSRPIIMRMMPWRSTSLVLHEPVTRPSRSTVTLSQRLMTSSILWDTKIRHLPSSRNRRRMPKRFSASYLVRELVGSSSMMYSASAESALAIWISCFCAAVIPAMMSVGLTSRPTTSRYRWAVSLISFQRRCPKRPAKWESLSRTMFSATVLWGMTCIS